MDQNSKTAQRQQQTGDARLPEYRDGILPTFFLSGFECSIFVWKDKGRRNLIAETQHIEHLDEDYAFLASLGIACPYAQLAYRPMAAQRIIRPCGGESPPRPRPYIDEPRRWQMELNRVTSPDKDTFSDSVDLADIRAAAERLRPQTDKDWC